MSMSALAWTAVSLGLCCSASAWAWADAVGYSSVEDLRAEGASFVVEHHHDWSARTRDSRYLMISGHQDPFRADNDYASLSWRSRDGKLLRKLPSPALTWLGVSKDARFVIGLSSLKLDNPYQLVVYDASGALLLKRHIAPSVACLTPARYRDLKQRHAPQFALLEGRTWTAAGSVYVDFQTIGMTRRLGPLWGELSKSSCPSPLSANFSESVTNTVSWYDPQDPAPEIVEERGTPALVRLKDPKGQWFTVPFRLDPPAN